VRVTQQGREVLRQEFGARAVVDPHDEVSMYWGWAFAWDGSPAVALKKGPARLSIEIEKAAEARHRHVDCVLLTNDPVYHPKEPKAALRRAARLWRVGLEARRSRRSWSEGLTPRNARALASSAARGARLPDALEHLGEVLGDV
jgi:hypothetical protein